MFENFYSGCFVADFSECYQHFRAWLEWRAGFGDVVCFSGLSNSRKNGNMEFGGMQTKLMYMCSKNRHESSINVVLWRSLFKVLQDMKGRTKKQWRETEMPGNKREKGRTDFARKKEAVWGWIVDYGGGGRDMRLRRLDLLLASRKEKHQRKVSIPIH